MRARRQPGTGLLASPPAVLPAWLRAAGSPLLPPGKMVR